MYVVTPTFEAEEDASETWEGKIAQIKKLLTQSFIDIKHEAKLSKKELLKKHQEQVLMYESQRTEITLTKNLLSEISN